MQNFETKQSLRAILLTFHFLHAKNRVCMYFIYSWLSPQTGKPNFCLYCNCFLSVQDLVYIQVKINILFLLMGFSTCQLTFLVIEGFPGNSL